MAMWFIWTQLSVGDYIAALPGFLALLCIAPSAFNALKGRDTSTHKDVIPGAKIGPFTVFDYMTGTLILTSTILTFNYIYSGGSAPEKFVNGSILMSMLVGIIIHFFKPRKIIHPLIPPSIIWGLASFSARYHNHVNPSISLLYTIATSLLCLSESVNTGETVKIKPTKRLGRRASFLTAQMAQGAFPKKSNVPPPTIQGLTRYESLPSEADLANHLNTLLRSKPHYERLTSVVITDPNGDAYWEAVHDFDARNHMVMRLVKDEAELMAYVKSLMFVSLPLDKPLWELHMIENENGNDAIVFSIHHALGDGVSIFNLAADIFTEADGKPLSAEPFERRYRKRKSESLLKAAIDYVLLAIKSFFKVAFLSIGPGDSTTVIKDQYKPYKFQPDRQIVAMDTIPLAIIKEIKAKFGVTVNDVLTSVLAGAFDRYLKDQAGAGANKDVKIRALLPLAFPRKATDLLCNLWCFVSVQLPVSPTIKSPSERLLASKETLTKLKNSPEAIIQFTLQELVSKILDVESTGQLALDLMSKHTCVFTNVIGPAKQIYCLNKPVLEIQGIIANVVNQISMVSYNNGVAVNFVVDPNVVKRADKLPGFFLAELEELHKAAADMK